MRFFVDHPRYVSAVDLLGFFSLHFLWRLSKVSPVACSFHIAGFVTHPQAWRVSACQPTGAQTEALPPVDPSACLIRNKLASLIVFACRRAPARGTDVRCLLAAGLASAAALICWPTYVCGALSCVVSWTLGGSQIQRGGDEHFWKPTDLCSLCCAVLFVWQRSRVREHAVQGAGSEGAADGGTAARQGCQGQVRWQRMACARLIYSTSQAV